jgi:hypothetical protein
MNEPVPDKGRVLTAMSAFWFEELRDVAPSHLISTRSSDFPEAAQGRDLEGRSMLCRVADMLPIECIVRGYLAGSRGRNTRHGSTHGLELPPACASRASCPSRCSRLRPRPRWATTRTSPSSARLRSSAPTVERARDIAIGSTRGRTVGARARHHHRRHQVRVRFHRW